jgi:transposase
MPKAFFIGLRDDMLAVARRGEATIAQVAKDFAVSELCLQQWLKLADTKDLLRTAASSDESKQQRELKQRNRLLDQETEVMRRAVTCLSRDINPR